MRRFNIYTSRGGYGRTIDVFISTLGGTAVDDRPPQIAQPLVFVDYDPDLSDAAPAMRLRTDDAQTLMDELWNCGLRPTEGSGSAGALAATERHLKDLQRLVFEMPRRIVTDEELLSKL